MNISKKSWHYKLLTYFDPTHKEMPTNMCAYFWKVSGHLLLMSITIVAVILMLLLTAEMSTRNYFRLNLDFLNINHLEPIVKEFPHNPLKFGLLLINESILKFLILIVLGFIGYIIIFIGFWAPIILSIYTMRNISKWIDLAKQKVLNSRWCGKIDYKD